MGRWDGCKMYMADHTCGCVGGGEEAGRLDDGMKHGKARRQRAREEARRGGGAWKERYGEAATSGRWHIAAAARCSCLLSLTVSFF